LGACRFRSATARPRRGALTDDDEPGPFDSLRVDIDNPVPEAAADLCSGEPVQEIYEEASEFPEPIDEAAADTLGAAVADAMGDAPAEELAETWVEAPTEEAVEAPAEAYAEELRGSCGRTGRGHGGRGG